MAPGRVCVFTLVKTQALFSHTLLGDEELCVAAMGAVRFSGARLLLRTFLFGGIFLNSKRNKKGFTIVELLIVIAVIAILATTLMPTFGNVIYRAQQAKDIQTVKNMNTALMIYSATMADEPMNSLIQDMDDVLAALAEAGYDTEDELTPVCKDHSFYWHKTSGQIAYVDEREGAFDLVYPENILDFPPSKCDESLENLLESFAGGQEEPPVTVPLQLYLTNDDYFTISNPDKELLSCGPGLVHYGDGKFAVAYLADETQTVESESNNTIVCRLGLFHLDDPENGKFVDIATAGQKIGDLTIGNKAPYEPNLMMLSNQELLILFNIHDNTGKYIYCYAIFNTVSETVDSYGVLQLDGKEWTPANVATSHNALADQDISTAGPTGSMVFTSQIIQHEGYYYGYCGGVCDGFAGILVRSIDGVHWESVMVPEAADEMKGVIECGFRFYDGTVYFCMRDISSGVYHCSYEWPTKRQLNETTKLPGLTTSKPATFIQDGNLYLIVNLKVANEATMGRRNTALFYQVDAKNCGLTLVRKVFCKGGCAYHSVVEVDGTNYWCFHTDSRGLALEKQGRSNLAFLQIPPLSEGASQDGTLEFAFYTEYLAKGCITMQTNPPSWTSNASNNHYQIPLTAFSGYNTVTITGNPERSSYIAFFTKRITSSGPVAYAEGTSLLILEPGEVVTLAIPSNAAYMYVLDTNGNGDSLLPQQVVFSSQEAPAPAVYGLNLNVATYKGCLTGGTGWKNQVDNDCYQFDLSEIRQQGYTKMTVTASADGRAIVAMFAEKMPVSGVTNAMPPVWADGWNEQAIIAAGQTGTFDIPDNAAYLFVLFSGSNVACPESIVFSK